MSSHKVGIPATMQAKLQEMASDTAAQPVAAAKPTSAPASTSRPIHPAVLTTFGPGKGGGSSEFSVWAYLTRPRPAVSDGDEVSDGDAPLPNLVTAQSNALRVYTVLPHGGTLALTAVYDNLAGTICSLDVVPGGTGGGSMCCCNKSARDEENCDDYLDSDYDLESGNSNKGCNCSYDGLLIGFGGHPRLSLVYPSTPMVGGGYWSSSTDTTTGDVATQPEESAAESKQNDSNTKTDSDETHKNSSGLNYGVGQGGVLLASSIIDLTPALIENSMGGTSYLEQDMIVSVSTSSSVANGVDVTQKKQRYHNNDPSVSVVLGGGVAIASFSLPKASRPEEGSFASCSWWRIASEPYVLPLPYLASKIRSDFGGGSVTVAAVVPKGKNQPTVVGNTGVVGHGFGDVLDIIFLSGYTEPTLLVLHTNPKRGGGRPWVGRMGRTEEIPVAGSGDSNVSKKDEDEMDEETKKLPETMTTGTKYGLTLTAISLAIHQHRSVVLWSLTDAIPADAWKLIPHPSNGVIVMGVNTIVYVGMGGKIQSCLAVNGFAKVGCPIGLIPSSATSTLGRHVNSIHVEANPSPLPLLALQLDGARVGFVSENVALICLGNGSLYSLELHNGGQRTFMSMSPLGHRVGGLGMASCVSVLAMGYHSKNVEHYLKNNSADKKAGDLKKEEPNEPGSSVEEASSAVIPSGPSIVSKGLVFVGSRMGDCTLLAFAMNQATRLIVTDVDAPPHNQKVKRKQPENASSSMSEPVQKQPKTDDAEALKVINNDNGEDILSKEDILCLEEEELYRDDSMGVDTTSPSLVSPSRTDSDDEIDELATGLVTDRRTVHSLTTFQAMTPLDSLTGLGALGKGVYGPIAALPCSTEHDGEVSFTPSESSALFSNAFASAARHFIMPCGFGASGGLAIVTTPGRDTLSVGGSILCEADLMGMSGSLFCLAHSNLVFLGKSDGVGAIVLRGVLGSGGEKSRSVEEFEEVDVTALSKDSSREGDTMEVDSAPSLHNVEDVIGKTVLLAASEFGHNNTFSVFLVKLPQEDGASYSIVIMKTACGEDNKNEVDDGIKLHVAHVHSINPNDDNRTIHSVTPMVSELSEEGMVTAVSFGCVWSSGRASVYNISVETSATGEFKVTESIFGGGESSTSPENMDNTEFFQSEKIVAMDLVSLPDHIFTKHDGLAMSPTHESTPDTASSLSFPPDRLSMHGSWNSKLDGSSNGPPSPDSSRNVTLIAICRRSGSLEVYSKDDAMKSGVIEAPSSGNNAHVSLIWKAEGCSHGVAVLGHVESNNKTRKPEGHDVETVEIRFFVSGPSLNAEIDNGAENDAWMLRSLCILVDTSLGDLHLYSGSKRRSNGDRLEFSRVPLSCVTRPSDEASRHFVKLRRKGIVPAASQLDFRPNRLHRFFDISLQDGLFAATPRPLWFVSERGAPAVVSHKSRHVSAAGTRQVPVSGFCCTMPTIFQNANKGFITLHERIGRVGSQRLTLFNGLWDVFAPRGLLPGGGICIQKHPLGVTVHKIEFIDDASISSPSRPIYAMLISREMETKQSDLNDDNMTPEERQRIKDEKEAAQIRKQVEADLGGFDIEQEWVEEIEREECFGIDKRLGFAPPMPTRKFEVWLVDASKNWEVLDSFQLDDLEHGTAMKVLYLTDVVEDSDEIPRKHLYIAVGTSVIEYDGEDLASKGNLVLFQVKKAKSKVANHPPLELVKRSEKEITVGPVTSLAALISEDIHRVAVGAGAEVTVEQWGQNKLTQVGFYHAHMQVLEIALFKTFFLLSDAYDSLHFLVWRESDKSLTLLAKDYEPCEVFAAGIISRGGAMSFVCHDDRQNLQFFQYAPGDAAARGGNKLVCRADFHLGAQTTSFQSHWAQSSLLFNSCTLSSTLSSLKQQDSMFGRLDDDQRFAVNFGTSEGSFGSVVPLGEPAYWRLAALQSVMSNALESNCALSHRSWRLFRRSTRRGGCKSGERKKGVIDADLVSKFVDLPLPEQEDLASSIGSTVALIMDNLLELGCAASVL